MRGWRNGSGEEHLLLLQRSYNRLLSPPTWCLKTIQFQGTWRPLLVSQGTRNTAAHYIYMLAKHPYTLNKQTNEPLKMTTIISHQL